uniref:Uncharacterized protein n=1 Tax=Melopsittacus undulatus TaxID=13146 RepID=A0A8V5GAA9_MELUD
MGKGQKPSLESPWGKPLVLGGSRSLPSAHPAPCLQLSFPRRHCHLPGCRSAPKAAIFQPQEGTEASAQGFQLLLHTPKRGGVVPHCRRQARESCAQDVVLQPDCPEPWPCVPGLQHRKDREVGSKAADVLVHEFSRSSCLSLGLGNHLVFVATAFIFHRGFLEPNSNYPVGTLKEKLAAELRQAFLLQNIDSCLPLLHQGQLNGVCHSNIFWLILNPEETPSTEEMSDGLAHAVSFHRVDFCKDKNGWVGVQEGWHVSKQYYLRPSILPYAQAIIQREAFLPETLYVISGLVFGKCFIPPCSVPVFHEMVFVSAINRGTEKTYIQMLVNDIKTIIYSLHKTEAMSFETTELNEFAALESQLSRIQYLICVETDTSASHDKGSCVGVTSRAHDELGSSELVAVFASLNLDLLATLICGRSDWRMLWTSNNRFFHHQFPRGELRLFQSFSLHPPSYVHDVSFWVPDGEQLDAVAFHSTARQVRCEPVPSMQLMASASSQSQAGGAAAPG